MNLKELVFVLSALRKERERLVNLFYYEDPDLYKDMFLFSANETQMTFAIEKYFFEWLGDHSKIQSNSQYSDSDCVPVEFINCWMQAYIKLCSSFIKRSNVEINHSSVGLFNDMIKSKINYLNKLIEIGGRQDEKIKRLSYYNIREKRLFQQKFDLLLLEIKNEHI